MSTHQRVSVNISGFLHYFVMAQLATNSVRVNKISAMMLGGVTGMKELNQRI